MCYDWFCIFDESSIVSCETRWWWNGMIWSTGNVTGWSGNIGWIGGNIPAVVNITGLGTHGTETKKRKCLFLRIILVWNS